MRTFPLHFRSSPFSRWRSKLSSHRNWAWWIALACAVFGVLTGLHIVIVPTLSAYSYWIVVGGLILLLFTTR
jgi:hypothetical protein